MLSFTGVAREFLEVVKVRWPEFIPSIKKVGGDLIIDHPSPFTEQKIWISADVDTDEIIIGFGGTHSHGYDWREIGSPDYRFEWSTGLIDDILSGVVFFFEFKSGEYSRMYSKDKPESPPLGAKVMLSWTDQRLLAPDI